ncbi:MAG: hypothetical protein JXQ72_01985 [Anaerolineae bacterium]|nr:hypothetical protein [Anaerolineae bacterium]
MELIAFVQLVRRRWWLIALPAVVVLILTLPRLKTAISPPVTYGVQVRLTVAAPPDAEIEGVTTPYEDTAYVPWLASEYVVVNMPAWITSDAFAAEVERLLDDQGLDLPGDDLRRAFAADSIRSVLVLYVGWDDAGEIRRITDAAITVLQTRTGTYFPQFAAQPAQVIPLDEVDVSQTAPPFTARLDPIIRLMIGLAAGIGLAVLAEYLDDSIRARADVEALGLPVLAEVPRER